MNRRFIAFVAALGIAGGAAAQTPTYPGKPIRLIAPFSPGGGTDAIARLLSKRIGEDAGWTIVVDNKPGASGTMGLSETARAEPDGYTLVVGQTDNISIAPSLLKVDFDSTKDFTPIGRLATATLVFVVPHDSPYRSIADIVDDAKRRPAAIQFGSNGTGSTLHLVAEQLQAEAGFEVTHIPYKGTAPALRDVVGGHVDFSGGSIASVRGLLETGKLRALAVTGDRRVPALPGVPTLQEEGFGSIVGLGWYGLFGPKGIPRELVAKINAEFNRAMQHPEVAKTFDSFGLAPATGSPEDFGEFLRNDLASWTNIVHATGMNTK